MTDDLVPAWLLVALAIGAGLFSLLGAWLLYEVRLIRRHLVRLQLRLHQLLTQGEAPWP